MGMGFPRQPGKLTAPAAGAKARVADIRVSKTVLFGIIGPGSPGNSYIMT
jgi:hypothetical protein